MSDFEHLRLALLRRDNDAIAEVFQRYGRRLIALANNLLSARLRQKVDADDIVQSVFRSFVARCGSEHFHLSDPESLWSLLVQITVRKCRRRARFFSTQARDFRSEVPLEQLDDNFAAIDPEPAPDEVMQLTEIVQMLLQKLDSPRKREICELVLQGYSVAEIGDRIGYYERGVLRVRAEIKAVLLSILANEEPPRAVKPG